MYEQRFNPYARNLSVIKEALGAPRVFVYALAKILSVVLSLIASIMISAHLPELLQYVRSIIVWSFDEAGVSDSLRADVLSGLDSITPSADSLTPGRSSLILPGLAAAALLIIFFKSRSSNPLSSPKAGVIILYILALVGMIGAILMAVLLAGTAAMLFLLYSQAEKAGDAMALRFFGEKLPVELNATLYLVLTIVAAACCVIAIFFLLFGAINKYRFYRSVRSGLSSVDLPTKGAAPYGVMCILAAIPTALAALATPAILFAEQPFKLPQSLTGALVVSALAQAASVVALIAEARVALRYKKHINDVKYGYQSAPAPAAPYAPFSDRPAGTAQPAKAKAAAPLEDAAKAPENPAAEPQPEEAAPAPVEEQAATCPHCGAAPAPPYPYSRPVYASNEPKAADAPVPPAPAEEDKE